MQCRLISCKKCVTLVMNVDSGRGGGDVCTGVRGIWEFSVLPIQF
jgi:hypothetical protein